MLYPRAVQRKGEQRLLILGAAVLVAFIALVGALDRFQPTQGLRIATGFSDTVDEAFVSMDRSDRSAVRGEAYSWIVSIVSGLSVLLFIIGVVRREHRFSTLILIPMGAALFFLFAALIVPAPEDLNTPLTQGQDDGSDGPPPAHGTMDEEDAVTVTTESEPDFNIWSIVLAAAATVALILVIGPRIRIPRRTKENELLAGAAERAVASANAGNSVAAVIIECYREMLEIMEQDRGVKRRYSMTPREFISRLTEAGVPAEHVEALTMLFERFRYGGIQLSRSEEGEALAHVTAISASLGRR